MPKAQNLKRIEAEFTLSLRDDEQGVISGTAHVCGVLNGTFPKSILEPGAFAKTLSERGNRVPLNVDHGDGLMAEVGYGEFSMNGNALVLDRGVLNLESTIVREEVYPRLKQRAEAGLPCGLSIEIAWPKDKVKMRDGVLHISEVKLNKVGIVDVPANEPSLVSTVMSEAEGTLDMGRSFTEINADMEERERISQVRERRWRLTYALMSAVGEAFSERTATSDSIKESAAQSVGEFSQAMAGWVDELIAIREKHGADALMYMSAAADEYTLALRALAVNDEGTNTDTLSLAEPGSATTPGEPEPATTPQGTSTGDIALLGAIDLKADSLRRYING